MDENWYDWLVQQFGLPPVPGLETPADTEWDPDMFGPYDIPLPGAALGARFGSRAGAHPLFKDRLGRNPSPMRRLGSTRTQDPDPMAGKNLVPAGPRQGANPRGRMGTRGGSGDPAGRGTIPLGPGELPKLPPPPGMGARAASGPRRAGRGDRPPSKEARAYEESLKRAATGAETATARSAMPKWLQALLGGVGLYGASTGIGERNPEEEADSAPDAFTIPQDFAGIDATPRFQGMDPASLPDFSEALAAAFADSPTRPEEPTREQMLSALFIGMGSGNIDPMTPTGSMLFQLGVGSLAGVVGEKKAYEHKLKEWEEDSAKVNRERELARMQMTQQEFQNTLALEQHNFQVDQANAKFQTRSMDYLAMTDPSASLQTLVALDPELVERVVQDVGLRPGEGKMFPLGEKMGDAMAAAKVWRQLKMAAARDPELAQLVWQAETMAQAQMLKGR